MTISETKKMAIINLTSDYPNKYTVNQLSNWAKVDRKSVDRLCKALNLEVYRGKGRPIGFSRPISGKSHYFK